MNQHSGRRSSDRRTLMVSIGGVLAVTLYAGLAAVQILVLNPLAAAPGRTLGAIHADLVAAGESLGTERALGILGAGVALAVAAAVACVLRKAPPIVPGMTFLLLLAFGAPAYFIASFSAGMALADTYYISGADASPWALPLYAVSAAGAAGVIVGTIVTARRRSPLLAPAS